MNASKIKSPKLTAEAAYENAYLVAQDLVQRIDELMFDLAGELRPETVYTLSKAKFVTSWGDASFRSARRNGLRVIYLGRQAFVKGSDLIAYIEKNGAASKSGYSNEKGPTT